MSTLLELRIRLIACKYLRQLTNIVVNLKWEIANSVGNFQKCLYWTFPSETFQFVCFNCETQAPSFRTRLFKISQFNWNVMISNQIQLDKISFN